ncbi:TetR/AcrR family transcriptional regulator [Aquincola sp. MAHUQ-54]|uniref:TetR/AcrR family transcriptional regulator n=1 Tax=Aquincola agrisoli TaxID=3119538 RepID=A0AAW9QL54_9BURK
MGRPRSAGFDDHRRDILDAGAALFAKHGYLGTSMNQVAEACGITKPALYHYYRDKDDLLLQIADGHVSALVDLVTAVERDAEPGEPRLRALLDRFLVVYAESKDKHRVLTEDVKYLQPDDLARVLAKERLVVDAFANAIGELRPDLREHGLVKPVTMLLFGMINWLFTWWRPGGRLGLEALIVLIDQFAMGGLAAVKGPAGSGPRPVL